MSARSCVVSISVVSPAAPIVARNARTACLLTTSRPIVGSSRNSTSGRCSNAAVISPRIRWPSDSWRTGVASNSSSPSSDRHSRKPRRVLGRRHPVDVAQQLERVAQRQIPPQLRPLAEHDADAQREARTVGHRPETAHAHRAAARRQHAGHHLERGRLAGAVRADVADHLAAIDREIDAVDRRDRPARTAEPPGLLGDRELLAQLARLDDRGHDPVLR